MTVTHDERRADILARMTLVMGELPTHLDGQPVMVQQINDERVGDVLRRELWYEDEPGSLIHAYLMLPANVTGKLPALICPHQTTTFGAKEPAGIAGKPNLHYALELAQRGYITLAPDLPSFGELAEVKPMPTGYFSGTMKDIHLHRRGLDLLASLDEVDASRMGSIGHSLGGHNTLFLAAFDDRVRVAASSCGFSSWEAYARASHDSCLAAWAQDRYMPRIRDVYHNTPAEMPFLFEEILEAILPRAIYTNTPTADHDMPIDGVKDCMAWIERVAQERDLPYKALAEHPECGHDFPPEQRENAYAFIDSILRT